MAVMGFVAQAVQLKYDESEGPTKPDNGENDDHVLNASSIDNDKGVTWTNPLLWRDNGAGDETVLMQSDGTPIVLRRVNPRILSQLRGDRVTEIVPVSREQLDAFFHPEVYGVVEDIYNTRHTFLPGHQRHEEDYPEPVYTDDWTK